MFACIVSEAIAIAIARVDATLLLLVKWLKLCTLHVCLSIETSSPNGNEGLSELALFGP